MVGVGGDARHVQVGHAHGDAGAVEGERGLAVRVDMGHAAYAPLADGEHVVLVAVVGPQEVALVVFHDGGHDLVASLEALRIAESADAAHGTQVAHRAVDDAELLGLLKIPESHGAPPLRNFPDPLSLNGAALPIPQTGYSPLRALCTIAAANIVMRATM